MVKLVTSRVHRCYSTTGGIRSARNERLNDIMHLAGSSLLLASSVMALPKVNSASLADRQTMAAFGSGLITLVQLCDMFAITMAHRMFYLSPRQTSKRKPFFESPTKVDGLIAALCLAASLAGFFSIRFPGAPNPTKDAEFGHELATLAFLLYLIAMFINSVIGASGLTVKLPLPLACAHSAVVSFFLVASASMIVLSLFAIWIATSDVLKVPLAIGLSGSYASIWVGSLVNLFRVKALLSSPRKPVGESSVDIGARKSTGLFSWFKASKSDSGDLSEFESDEFDEEDGYSSDGDRKWRR